MTRLNATAASERSRDIFKDKPKKKDKDRSQDAASTVSVGEHGRYQIKSGRLSGEYVARAFPKPPTNARGLIAEAKGATEDAAIAALRELIDARDAQRNGSRRIDANTGAAVPSTEEYVEVIRQVALSMPQRAMLVALALAEEDGLPEKRLASAAGYKTPASANRSFAGAGLLMASYLSIETTPDADSNVLEGTSILGFRGAQRSENDPGNWILFPELRDAVRLAL